MPRFIVYCTYRISGSLEIEAESLEEAGQMAEMMNVDDMDAFDNEEMEVDDIDEIPEE